MKTYILILFVIHLLCSGHIYQSKRKIIDYRDSYVGEYLCHKKTTFVNQDGRQIKNDTVFVAVSKAETDSVLNITINNVINTFRLKNKFLYAYPAGGSRGGKFFGLDSLMINISPGRTSSSVYIGKKI